MSYHFNGISNLSPFGLTFGSNHVKGVRTVILMLIARFPSDANDTLVDLVTVKIENSNNSVWTMIALTKTPEKDSDNINFSNDRDVNVILTRHNSLESMLDIN